MKTNTKTIDAYPNLSFNQRRALFLLAEGRIDVFNKYATCLTSSEKSEVMELVRLSEIK